MARRNFGLWNPRFDWQDAWMMARLERRLNTYRQGMNRMDAPYRLLCAIHGTNPKPLYRAARKMLAARERS